MVITLVLKLIYPVDGVSNQLPINQKNQLNKMYGEIGIWEKFHCSEFMRIITKEENDILANLDKDKSAQLKKLVISSILATDIMQHFN